MPLIQIQVLRDYRREPFVTSYLNIDVANHREYLDALQSVEMTIEDSEYTRTVGDGAPLAVGSRDFDSLAD